MSLSYRDNAGSVPGLGSRVWASSSLSPTAGLLPEAFDGHFVLVAPESLVYLTAAVLLAALFLALRHRTHLREWEPVEAEVNFAELGKVTLRPNAEDGQIAHKAWVQLVTRKAALPFDADHDLILEVYQSWYSLFGELRALTSSVPATRIRKHPSTRQLVDTLVKVQNRGLRPHLTRWQARFRHWWTNESKADRAQSVSPQELQRQFPAYEELLADLQEVQAGLRRYTDLLEEISTGRPSRRDNWHH